VLNLYSIFDWTREKKKDLIMNQKIEVFFGKKLIRF
jgi:hypothetical protein